MALLAVWSVVAACGGGESASTTTEGPVVPRPTLPEEVPSNPSPGCFDVATKVQPGRTELVVARPEGARRSFLTVPPAHNGRAALPLVVDLHGYSEGAQVHLTFTGFPALGEKEGFLTLTPQGSGDPAFWNSFGQPAPDDVAFLTALLEQVGATHCVDRRRTFVAGMSNGAFMASVLACELPSTFGAAAMVAGLQFPDGCEDGRPVPVVAFHGTDDEFVRYEGGFGEGVRTLGVDPAMAGTAGRNRSVPDAAAAWAKRNDCADETTEKEVADDVELLRWRDCTASTELYVVEGGGHSWPGSEFSKNIADVVGRTTDSVDATKASWKFFEAHPSPFR